MAKIPFDKVIENLKRGKYNGRCCADYANSGVQLFEEKKFAVHLGSTPWKLREMGLVKITEQNGWNLPTQPTVKELLSFKSKLNDV